MLTHRRNEEKLSDGWVILFCETNRNDGYGPHRWTLTDALDAKLPRSSECEDLINFTMEFYGIDRETAENEVDPDDIVSTAMAWDDASFVSELWQAMEAGTIKKVPGYRTYDGAAVLDRESVEMVKDYDDPNSLDDFDLDEYYSKNN